VADKTENTSPEEEFELSPEESEAEEEFSLNDPPEDGLTRRWYVLHAYSGRETAVRNMLLSQVQQKNLEHLICNAFVPIEQVEVIKGGQKRISKQKCFPGYVLLQLPEHPETYPDLWMIIRETPSILGFIGSKNVPVPLEDEEVQHILEVVRGERERPKVKIDFEKGERIRIVEGPFANFFGNIEEIDTERNILKVSVEIFDRQTSVEVEHWQIEQI
jgi:transcriptional antiterminator NusG